MRESFLDKQYSIITGKLHLFCPHREETGVNIHVVIKDGSCYRSKSCFATRCRYNRIKGSRGKRGPSGGRLG
ncbi:MAG TPA: hypothetical protein DCP92_08800 [Nitrospiraceae bacterium]|jgi:hypothetical protein|nr:hypothetical protein [Nitrospiraceae bacterium]